VTADVVYGFAHYSRATGGEASLREGAAEAVVETARYWLARLDRRPGDAHPSLLGVMGPDEYKPIVSNNAYTNRLVSFALEVAARVGAAGGASDAECRAFADAAAALPLLRRADGLVLQCEEFERLARPPFDEFWTDRAQPFARFVSPERLYRTRCLKQADVLMLMMLFPEEFTDQEVRQAWDYYLPLTTHDSSLSASVHAIVASRLGLEEAAWTFWKSSAGLDLRVEHGGAAEGVHIAAAGGNWMAAVLGFAGMRTALQADVLTLRPRLPKAWRRLDFPLVWKGVPVHVDITPGATTVTNRGTAPLEACVSGRTQTVAPGAAATFAAAGPPQGGPSAASRPVP
jgi:kojibiose phosphorylase